MKSQKNIAENTNECPTGHPIEPIASKEVWKCPHLLKKSTGGTGAKATSTREFTFHSGGSGGGTQYRS